MQNPALYLWYDVYGRDAPFYEGAEARWRMRYNERKYTERNRCCREFAWAIPTEEVIRAIVELGPVVEIGAGRGYWAWCIEQLGGDVVAYDSRPAWHPQAWDDNGWLRGRMEEKKEEFSTHQWFPVLEGGPEKVTEWPDRTLLLCWPPYSNDMASDCLKPRPKRVVYVGEGYGGCTGDDEFHETLDNSYVGIDAHIIPQWDGIHDSVEIYELKGE